jgi:hypothetical protein
MDRTLRIATAVAFAAALGAWAQSAPAPTVQDLPPATSSAANATTLPAQTPIALQLETHLSTRDNKYGDGFAARVSKPIFLNGQEMVPAGSILEGHVIRVQDERPAVADSELMLKPDLLTTPDGRSYVISAEVIQSDPITGAKLNSEGVLQEPRGMMSTDLHHTELGAGGGAVGGALLAGGAGAAAGAGVGAAVAVGIWLVRHRHLELDPGSTLVVKLDEPLTMSPAPEAALR